MPTSTSKDSFSVHSIFSAHSMDEESSSFWLGESLAQSRNTPTKKIRLRPALAVYTYGQPRVGNLAVSLSILYFCCLQTALITSLYTDHTHDRKHAVQNGLQESCASHFQGHYGRGCYYLDSDFRQGFLGHLQACRSRGIT